MAVINSGPRGKSVILTAEDSATIASMLSSRAAVRKLSTQQIGQGSTLSDSTIEQRLRGSGGDHMSLWSLIALCDALGIDPEKTASRIDIEIRAVDIAAARTLVASRRDRRGIVTPPAESVKDSDAAILEALDVELEPTTRPTDDSKRELGVRFQELIEGMVNRRIEELLGA